MGKLNKKDRTNASKLKCKENLLKGNLNYKKLFQNVLHAAHNSKYSEFSLQRNSQLSDSLKESIKETKKMEFKSCSIQLSRVHKNAITNVLSEQKQTSHVKGKKNKNKGKMQPKRTEHANFQNEDSAPLRQIRLQAKSQPTLKSNAIKDIPENAKIEPIRIIARMPSPISDSKTCVIPLEVEQEINKYAKEAMTLGWTLIKKQLPYFIQHCINKRELDVFSNGLKLSANNLPSTGFIKFYMRKFEPIYKDVIEDKSPKSLTTMDEKNLFYFNLCWHLINQYSIKLESFLNQGNANRIFCCADYSFASDFKNFIEISEGLTTAKKKKGENVFFCASATGKVFNPLVMNMGLILKTYESSNYADDKYWQQTSQDGMMCAESFHLWLITAFETHLVEKNIQRPVILFFNSDSPYLSIPVLDFCKENEIILFAIPSCFSNLVNPLNMSCFDSLSMEYCRIFRKRAEIAFGRARQFSPLILIAAMDRINFGSCAQMAFEKSGLLKKESYPLDADKKNFQFNLEERLPNHLKNNSYDLGKEVGKLMCYQEIMSTSASTLNTSHTTDRERQFYNKMKKLYLGQSEKCTEMLDYYEHPTSNLTQEHQVKTCSLNTSTLNAENIFGVNPAKKTVSEFIGIRRDLF